MKQVIPSMEEAKAKVVARALEARQRADGRPFLIGHFITNRCPCKCASCLWLHNDWEDVPLEDLKRFYSEAREEGFIGTAITGGEPFIRKDLGQIVRFMKEEAGMHILLFNTGWYLKERMDEVLPYIDMMLLSLDSARPEKHDEIRGLRGIFDRLIEAVGLAKTRYPEISYQFNCCVQKGIADEIDDLVRLTENMGLRISFDVITEYRHGEGGRAFTSTDMGLPADELQEVCAYILERKRAGAPIVNLHTGEETRRCPHREFGAVLRVLRRRATRLSMPSAQARDVRRRQGVRGELPESGQADRKHPGDSPEGDHGAPLLRAAEARRRGVLVVLLPDHGRPLPRMGEPPTRLRERRYRDCLKTVDGSHRDAPCCRSSGFSIAPPKRPAKDPIPPKT
jgi:MoaA/NifB/PqqE/SkfB family radical SAM enzyme